MERSLEQQIRERAYDIWNASGRENGRAAEHWLSAERELLASQAAAAEIEIRRSKKSKGNRPRVTLRADFQGSAKPAFRVVSK